MQKDFHELVERMQQHNLHFSEHHILITGVAGFIGSWLAESLLKLKNKVVGIDNFSSGTKENIINLMVFSEFQFIEHDVTRPLPKEAQQDFDYIFHLASMASPFEFPIYPLEILKTNIMGTINIIEFSLRKEIELVFSSTSEIYGEPHDNVPTPETFWGYVNSLGIRSCYDEGKRASEALLMAAKREYGLNAKIARIFNTYGARMRYGKHHGRVIPNFVVNALQNRPIEIYGSGIQTRSFLYILDLIEALILLANTHRSEMVFNLGNPQEITIIELARIILKLTKSNSQVIFRQSMPDDPSRRCPDITKAQTILKWHPKIDLEDGLRRTINFYRKTINSPIN